MERAVSCFAVNPLVRIAGRCARSGYAYMAIPYTRTDDARNSACLGLAKMVERSHNPRDTLVMLDCDHEHPVDIVHRLVAHDVGVVGALYYRRSEPYDAMAFFRDKESGELRTPAVWDKDAGLVPCACVGTGAIAIQAWVLQKLMDKGFTWPFFRYLYSETGTIQPTEDMYFGAICEKAGIPHHVDFSLMTPHLTTTRIDGRLFEAHLERDAEAGRVLFEIDEELLPRYPWLATWNDIQGWLTQDEAIHLYETARALPGGAQAVELGTFQGRSTVALGLGALQAGGHVMSIDQYRSIPNTTLQGDITKARASLDAFGINGTVSLVEADSRRAAETWSAGDKLALLFVDAGHEEADCYGDARAWLPHCQDGAAVLFHDYVDGWPGVVAAVNRLADEGHITLQRQVGSIVHCVKAGG